MCIFTTLRVYLTLNCVNTGTSDFSLGVSVTIPAGTTLPTDGSHCVAVSGTEDTLLEGDEAFGARISGTDQSAVVSVGASDTATVTITDNDGAYDRNCDSICLINATRLYVPIIISTHLLFLLRCSVPYINLYFSWGGRGGCSFCGYH